MIKRVSTPFLVVISLILLASCKHEIPIIIPPPPGVDTTNGICFQNDILPIFQTACAKSGCHDAGSAEEGYVLDSYSNIVKRGIKAGNASDSKLYEVLFKSGNDRMPQPPSPALTDIQKYLIQTWINEGAVNSTNCSSCDSSTITYNGGVKPILQNYCYSCHSGSASSGGGIPLDTYDAVKAQVTFNALYPAITHTGGVPMPQGADKLSDCRIAVFRKWIDAGAINN